MAHSLPVIDAEVEGCTVRALVDTGCATTVVSSHVVGNCEGVNYMVAFDGSQVRCQGRRTVQIVVRGEQITVDAVVADHVLGGVDVVMGLDAIDSMGGVTVINGTVEFGTKSCCAVMEQPENMVTFTDKRVRHSSQLLD